MQRRVLESASSRHLSLRSIQKADAATTAIRVLVPSYWAAECLRFLWYVVVDWQLSWLIHFTFRPSPYSVQHRLLSPSHLMIYLLHSRKWICVGGGALLYDSSTAATFHLAALFTSATDIRVIHVNALGATLASLDLTRSLRSSLSPSWRRREVMV